MVPKMENFKNILIQQKEALTKDAEILTKLIEDLELQLEEKRDRKNEVNAQLRSISKKLEKIG